MRKPSGRLTCPLYQKCCHQTLTAALKMIRALVLSKPVNIYPCHACAQFHIGRASGSKKNRWRYRDRDWKLYESAAMEGK